MQNGEVLKVQCLVTGCYQALLAMYFIYCLRKMLMRLL